MRGRYIYIYVVHLFGPIYMYDVNFPYIVRLRLQQSNVGWQKRLCCRRECDRKQGTACFRSYDTASDQAGNRAAWRAEQVHVSRFYSPSRTQVFNQQVRLAHLQWLRDSKEWALAAKTAEQRDAGLEWLRDSRNCRAERCRPSVTLWQLPAGEWSREKLIVRELDPSKREGEDQHQASGFTSEHLSRSM